MTMCLLHETMAAHVVLYLNGWWRMVWPLNVERMVQSFQLLYFERCDPLLLYHTNVSFSLINIKNPWSTFISYKLLKSHVFLSMNTSNLNLTWAAFTCQKYYINSIVFISMINFKFMQFIKIGIYVIWAV